MRKNNVLSINIFCLLHIKTLKDVYELREIIDETDYDKISMTIVDIL